MNLWERFGFALKPKNQKDPIGEVEINKPNPSFIAPSSNDGAIEVVSQYSDIGVNSAYVNFNGMYRTDADLIYRYRSMALHPELDMAIQDIVTETIIVDEDNDPVSVDLEKIQLSDSIKKKIHEEFNHILDMMNFNSDGAEIFERWYVDGRIYYHMISDSQNLKKGIVELRQIDAAKLKKVREVVKKENEYGAEVVVDVKEFYLFENDNGIRQLQEIQIDKSAVAASTSGIIDWQRKSILSHLHKAIKPYNQLRMIEDAVVIYRISRAPERRLFYIDVGNLPKAKAEQYVQNLMSKYRNKLTYDATTGELKDNKQHMHMLEDFWLPRREGGRGTEISTLPGGQSLGEIDDVEYFQRKLYLALNIPRTRLEASTGFNMGRSSEITRDELKFARFISKLRRKFSTVFNDILKTHLILKGIITERDWEEKFKNKIRYDFATNSFFDELKEAELWTERIQLADSMEGYVGKYFSNNYIKRQIFKMTEEQMDQEEKLIKTESGEDDEAHENVVRSEPQPEMDEDDLMNAKKNVGASTNKQQGIIRKNKTEAVPDKEQKD